MFDLLRKRVVRWMGVPAIVGAMMFGVSAIAWAQTTPPSTDGSAPAATDGAVPASGAPVADGCGTRAAGMSTSGAAAEVRRVEQATHTTSDSWYCQRIASSGAASATAHTNCFQIRGACPGCPNDVKCCAPNTGTSYSNACHGNAGNTGNAGTGGPTNGAPPSTAPAASGGIPSFDLPGCIRDGSCGLNDIVNTGISFANFLIGLSGAVFFAIFVWAGAQYVFFAYDSGAAKKSKTTMIEAATGMMIIICSSLIMRFVRSSIVGDQCFEQMGSGYACTDTTGMRSAARHACRSGLCPGGSHFMCCPLGTGLSDAPSNGSGGGAPGGPSASNAPSGSTDTSNGSSNPSPGPSSGDTGGGSGAVTPRPVGGSGSCDAARCSSGCSTDCDSTFGAGFISSACASQCDSDCPRTCQAADMNACLSQCTSFCASPPAGATTAQCTTICNGGCHRAWGS